MNPIYYNTVKFLDDYGHVKDVYIGYTRFDKKYKARRKLREILTERLGDDSDYIIGYPARCCQYIEHVGGDVYRIVSVIMPA